MLLTPVESSHIAAIGYLEAERVLLVRYKDGSLYARAHYPPAEHESLMRAPSKGKVLASLAMVLISKGVMPTDKVAAVAVPGGNEALIAKGGGRVSASENHAASGATAGAAAPLNIIDEDADRCCRDTLNHMFARGIDQRIAAECGNCGTRFYPEMIGVTCYWRIKSNVAIVRPRR